LIVVAFGVELEVAFLITTLFLLGYVAGPILWGPGSEVFGRRTIFCVIMVIYTLFILGQALAPNIQTLLVTRFFSGFFACAPLTNSGGVIADIWDPVTRGLASSIFTTMVFLGPVMGPIVAGFIVQDIGNFRWVFWVMMMFAGTCSVITIAFLPETYAPKILAAKVRRLFPKDDAGR
jgi:DHA1 family multidrug resistance protein-like MFS transporter